MRFHPVLAIAIVSSRVASAFAPPTAANLLSRTISTTGNGATRDGYRMPNLLLHIGSVVAQSSHTIQRSSSSSSRSVALWLGLRDDTDVDGLRNAPVFFAAIVLLAVWLFSIPPDFRRARFCTEQQILDNPTSRCTTVSEWSNGIAQYYKEGGNVKFDFSVEKEGNVWVGGDSIDYSAPPK
jgi:hypothetical protein